MLRHFRLWLILVGVIGLVGLPGAAVRMPVQDQENLVCPTCESCTSVLVG